MRWIARLCVACLMLLSITGALRGQNASHTVAMELRRNMPFVQVGVNGQGPFTFAIDTGTGGEALVSGDLIERLNLPVTGETEVGDPSGRASRKVPVIGVRSLTVAGVEFKNVQAARFDPSPRDGRCDGILGFVLFRDYVLTLDYPLQQLTLAFGKLAPDGGETVLPFTMPDNVPVVELTAGSRKVDAHLDSRGMGLSLPEKFAQGLQFVSEPAVIARGRTVSGEFEIKGAQLASDVRLAGYTFLKPFVEINAIFPVANIGSIPMHNFAVTFDQKNKLVRLVSTDKAIIIAAPQRMLMHLPEGQPQPAVKPDR
jgi:hypothetical protein